MHLRGVPPLVVVHHLLRAAAREGVIRSRTFGGFEVAIAYTAVVSDQRSSQKTMGCACSPFLTAHLCSWMHECFDIELEHVNMRSGRPREYLSIAIVIFHSLPAAAAVVLQIPIAHAFACVPRQLAAVAAHTEAVSLAHASARTPALRDGAGSVRPAGPIFFRIPFLMHHGHQFYYIIAAMCPCFFWAQPGPGRR